MLDLTAAAFVFLAVALLLIAFARSTRRPIEARIRTLSGKQPRGPGLAATPFHERTILPVIEGLGRATGSVLPTAFARRTEQRLVAAGSALSPAAFYSVIVLLAGGLGALGFLLVAVPAGPESLGWAILLALLLAPLGGFLPVFWLSSQAKGRQRAILKALPDSLDLLTVCVEAGLGLDAAFHRVTEKQPGPFSDEIRQMLREIGLGRPRKEALFALADRTGVEDVRSFILAVVQAEQLGTGLAQVLRVQSQRIRTRRRQRAEQEARRAPVKIVFPLVFCLMPSLFIFILGPIIVSLVDFLSGT